MWCGQGSMLAMVVAGGLIRPAGYHDAAAVCRLAEQLATSFPFSTGAFLQAFSQLREAKDAALLVAEDHSQVCGYLLGFAHPAFFAGGPVGWVEEVIVAAEHRGVGLGTALIDEFEKWATNRGCRLVALATSRATAFYQTLGYSTTAAYLRKPLPRQAG
jgi:GNAT superfamily N-acetyltransferase